jgi:hypothetical protein
MLRPPIRHSAIAGHRAATRAQGAAITGPSLAQICTVTSFRALTTPFFPPLSIG